MPRMKKEKKPVHTVTMTDGKRAIIQQLLQEYEINSAEDIQNALKDLLGGTIKEMMEAEMDNHLGYEKSGRVVQSEDRDYRNGTNLLHSLTLNTSVVSFTRFAILLNTYLTKTARSLQPILRIFIQRLMNSAQLKSVTRWLLNGKIVILML